MSAGCCSFASASAVPRAACAARGCWLPRYCWLRRAAVRFSRRGLWCRVACGARWAPRLCVASLVVRARASGRPVSGRSGWRLLCAVLLLAPGLRPPCGLSLRLARGCCLSCLSRIVLRLIASPLVAAEGMVQKRSISCSDLRRSFLLDTGATMCYSNTWSRYSVCDGIAIVARSASFCQAP